VIHQANYLSGRLRLKCDGTRAETRFRLSAKRTSPFKSAGVSVQSTAGRRAVRISLQGLYCSCKFCVLQSRDAYWLPTPFFCFPFTSPPVRHRVPSHFNWTLNTWFFCIFGSHLRHNILTGFSWFSSVPLCKCRSTNSMERRSLLSVSFQIHQSYYRVPSKLQTHSAFIHIDKQVYIDATVILTASIYCSTKFILMNRCILTQLSYWQQGFIAVQTPAPTILA
jgi:hypothetical protein